MLSGVGLPVISSMGIQCCPVPTAILSNHVGFDQFFFDDYTDKMEPYVENGKNWDYLLTALSPAF